MKIMSVAMDMSATGTMSLDTAITQLNATLNGNIGRLGQQNAELKGLTEEELKSGKAVEILGEKFKGLAQSTLDTSKQLKNIKGDFKEAIGEFTLPTSDMWNKFWIGFYDKGISVIKQFDEYMDKTIIGKGIADELIKGYKTISDERQKVLYLEDNIHALTETQIVALQKHLESTKNRNKEQEELLRKVKMEVESRKYLAKIYADMEKDEAQRKKTEEEQLAIENEIAILKGQYLEKMAEQERKWQNIKEVTGEQVSNEEKIKFYQDSLVDLMTKAGGQITTNNQLYKDQMAIIEKLSKDLAKPTEELEKQKKVLADIVSWEMKLRQQEIDRISLADKEVVDYGAKKSNLEKIFKLNTEQLEAQMQAELKGVEETANAEEAKAKIVEYYNNEKLALTKGYNEEIAVLTRQEEEENWRIQKEQYQKLAKLALDYVKKIGNAFSKIGQIVQNVFKGVVNYTKDILQKLFKGNINDLLDELLKFEDGILTFFVETLPQLPSFFASALQSVSVMLENVLQIITPEKISEIMISILQTIQQYAPTIIGAIAEIITNMLDGIINSLPQILDTLNVVVEKLAEVLPQLIQKLIDLFIGILQEPEKIADLVITIIKAFVEIFKVILKNIGPLLEALLPAIGTLIIEIIKAIPDILASMGEALWEAVKGIGKFVVNMLIEVINGLLDGISAAWTWIPGTKGIPHIPKLATGTDDAKKGLAIVGEAGPELVNFRGGEQVLNNRNTQKALAGMGNNGNTFNVTFNNTMDTTAYAMMSQLRQYNRTLAINGVI